MSLKYKKLTLFILALFGLNMNMAWARNYTLSHSSADSTTLEIRDCPDDPNKFIVIRDGTQLQYDYDALGNITSSGRGAVNIEFYTTRTVLMNGNIEVSGNYARLYLQKKVLTEAELPTLKRNSATGNLMSADSKGMFYIYGYDNSRGGHFIIDSGAVYPDEYDARVPKSEIVTKKAGRIIRSDKNLTIKYATLQNSYHDADFGGAGIGCRNAQGPNGTQYTIDLEDVVFRGLWSRQGAAINFYEEDNHAVTCKRINVYFNHSTREVDDMLGSGIIRSWGNTSGWLDLDSCNIHHNLSDYGGGGIYWNASGRDTLSRLYVTGHTQIHDNEAVEFGGGIVAKSTIIIDTASIYNNVSKRGGGIHVTPYTGGMYYYSGEGTKLRLGGSVSIYGNEATEMGGGVYYAIYKSNDVGFTPTGSPISPEYRLDIAEGAEIYENTAPLGAGVALDDYAPFRHRNSRESEPAYNKWSKEIRRSINITGGVIRDNYCTETANNVQGGGFYIWKHKADDLGYTWAQAQGAGTMFVNILGGVVKDNVARNNNHNGVGGGFYIENTKYTTANYTSYCPVIIGDPEGVGEGVTIEGNTSDGNGAGLYIAQGDLNVYGGSVGTQAKPNIAYNGNGAGVYLAGGNITINGGDVKYNHAIEDSEYGGGSGGAFYLDGGIATISGGNVSNNIADKFGGGFYIDSQVTDTHTIEDGAVISYNQAVSGAGAYVAQGSLIVKDAATDVNSNTASNSGGGIYMAGGSIRVQDANITHNNTDSYGKGGGLFMYGGEATLTGSSVRGNTAPEGWGGGIYMEGGVCTVSSGAMIGEQNDPGEDPDDPDDDIQYANSAGNGGGIYSAGGTITVKGGSIGYNTATERGGGIYANGDKAKVYVQADDAMTSSLSYIEHNTAPYGGGIYAERGRVEFSDGFIQYNHASEQGGGLYVDTNDTLYLKGSANLYRNNVPEHHDGGGVYLKGSIIVGEEGATGVIKAQENFAGDEYVYQWNDTGHPLTDSIDQVTANNRNNIYLPAPAVYANHRDVITIIEDGITDASRVGFSVPRNYVPVIYCAPSATSHDYLNQFSTGHENQYMIFDDTRHYVAVYYSDKPEIFDPNHVYLYGFWSNIVTGQPDDPCYVNPSEFDPMNISTPCELAFFISWVNGLNTMDPHPNDSARLVADIDMSEFGWVPIGHLTDGYRGVFDGNGHTVSGISSLLYREYLDYGFFGKLNGGTVKNLFVKEAVYAIESKDGIIIGGLAAEATNGSVVENSEVRSVIVGDHPNTIMGGLIGRMGNVLEATSSDWMVSGDQVPVNGVEADRYQKSEFVIPASELAGYEGSTFGSMTFYLSSPASQVWQDAAFQVFLKPATSTTLSGFSGTSGATVVYEGSLDATGLQMTVNFSTPYSYNGGNLLVGVYETTPGAAYTASFQGVGTDNASYHGENETSLEAITSGTSLGFRPKVTFAASTQQVLVANGTSTNSEVPVYGGKAASYNKMEFIVPAAELMQLEGGNLNQMQFFLYSQASNTWGNAEFRVFLKEVDNATVSGFSGTDGATVVYEGKLFGNSPTMTVDFTTTYRYNGGNLLVGIYQYKKGTNRAATFYGVVAENASIQGFNSNNLNNITSGTTQNFRPKTQFSTTGMVVHNMVCDGAVTNTNIPVCGASANKYQKNEFVIPASDLTDMTGAAVNSMKFYLTSKANDSWGDATFKVFLKEVESATVSGFTGTDGATVVYEGVLDATGSTMMVYFNDIYTYQGGNLLVGIYQTATGTAKEATFAGIEIADAGIHGENASGLANITSGTTQNFRPKTVFGYTPSSSASSPLVHSSIAVADLSGYLMGGLVGQIVNGTLSNSFSNTKFSFKGISQYMGGLVGINSGTVENCYVRLRNASVPSGNFGWLVGKNNTSGIVNYCYSKAADGYFNTNNGTGNGCGYYENNTQVPYAYARRDNQVIISDDVDVNNGSTENTYVPSEASNPNPYLNYGIDKQMLLCLNEWVRVKNAAMGPNPTFTYTGWSRPTTKVINDDLPVLLMPKGNAVYCTGNADGTAEDEAYLNYGDVNTMLGSQTDVRHAIWLYDTPTRNGTGANITVGNVHSDAKLYIAERNIAGKPLTVIQSDTLLAYVGVTLDNTANVNGANATFGDGTPDYTDWHMFATPLANAPLGIDYEGDLTQWHGEISNYDYYSHPADMPYYRFFEDGRGYFPSRRYGTQYPANSGDPTAAGNEGNYYKEWDFYTYYEPEYHWINFKRNSQDHWHENAHDAQIHYYGDGVSEGNETTLVKGRGYLLATREETFLQCHGTLNGTGGEIHIPVTRSGQYSPGYNFLGNPYLAYLDFDKFAENNADLWGSKTPNYAVIDEDERGYIYYATDGSVNPATASKFIAPHQGFMILVPDDEDVDLSGGADFYSEGASDMRDLTGDEGKFRGSERPAYALVNLFATDDNGNRDMVTVELGRPDKGGARLMRELRLAKGHVWCHYEGEDWSIAFTQPGLSEAAIRFETYEDGEYTMRWDTQNGEFSYLHLIDNMTGADIDCLSETEYRFASSTGDYKSRFRLVFGYTGIEETEDDGTTAGTSNFAYQSGDELVVTGEGLLQLFDVTGRELSRSEMHGVQGTVGIGDVTPGVYLLRLTGHGATRVQRIVINK